MRGSFLKKTAFLCKILVFPVYKSVDCAFRLQYKGDTKQANGDCIMTTNFDKTYTTMASAKRAARKAQLSNPVYIEIEGGKVRVTEAPTSSGGARTRVSSVDAPVAAFRELFDSMYGDVSRAQLLNKAAEQGIAKNTAATYYYKFSKALRDEGDASADNSATEDTRENAA
jgi:hypothetical protein